MYCIFICLTAYYTEIWNPHLSDMLKWLVYGFGGLCPIFYCNSVERMNLLVPRLESNKEKSLEST